MIFPKNPVERSATADSKTEPVNITSGDLDCTRYAVLKNPFNPDEVRLRILFSVQLLLVFV